LKKKSKKKHGVKIKIGILGTGGVGRTLAVKLFSEGHEVMIGTRNVDETLSKTESDAAGNLPFKEWQEENHNINLGTFADAAKFGEAIILATLGIVTLNAIDMSGKENFKNKVVIDTTNPLDFSKGVPPQFTATPGNSLGEQIQKHIPEARLVKAFNTIGAHIMINPKREEGIPDLFIAGNDESVKNQFKDLIGNWGWGSIIDMGDISQAYWLETFAMLWIHYAFRNNNWNHAFKLLKN
jgi:predicted dinucleotide-binding enzyme